MYNVVDIVFATIILVAGLVTVYTVLLQGSTYQVSDVPGVKMCLYQYIKSGDLPAVIEQILRSYSSLKTVPEAQSYALQTLIHSCQALNITITCNGTTIYNGTPLTYSEETQIVLPVLNGTHVSICILTIYVR